MPEIVPGKMRAGEVFERMQGPNGARLYEEAYKDGKNFSRWLDKEMGVEAGAPLDGFEQLLAVANITTRSIPEEGIWADSVGAFFEDKNRALLPEFVARQWRKVSLAHKRGTDIYMSSDMFAMFTGNVSGAAQVTRDPPLLEPAVPLAELVAVTTGITGTTTYEAMYLVEPPVSETRMVRIGETAEIPRAKITTGKSAIKLQKYGRGLEASYEELRRMRIDRLAFHIQRIAVQSEIDKGDAIVDVLINGDGNANAAASTNISTLDAAATGGALSVLGWITWKVGWNNGAYRLTSVLIRQATAVKVLMLSMGNANYPYAMVNANMALGGFEAMGNAQRTLDNVRYGVTETVGATMVLGLDARQAIERVYEIGGSVQEVARFITRQTEVMTMTEVEGFAKIDVNAARILNLA
jgi:hypothetical protein